MAGPLANIRVIEMAVLGPCPLAGQLLGDLGADVIVIDRKSGKYDKTDVSRRSKRSIALDLKKPEGVEILLQLVETTDVLIEGFRPGVMEKLGLGPSQCHDRNPALVYGRMTGWGQDGPLSSTAGHDINYLAITGALHAIGRREGPPVPPLNLAADYAGGTMFLIFGVLSALIERQQSGKGQVVDTAMVDCVPLLTGIVHMFLAGNQWSNERESNLLDGGAPFYRCYETADGKYLSVGPLEPQFFAQLVEKGGLPLEDTKSQYDLATWEKKHAAYEKLFKTRTREEWMDIFDSSDACVAPVLNWSEMTSHPHNIARGIFIERDGVTQAAPAPRFDRSVPEEIKSPATAGADTGEILSEIGITEIQQAQYKSSGVLT